MITQTGSPIWSEPLVGGHGGQPLALSVEANSATGSIRVYQSLNSARPACWTYTCHPRHCSLTLLCLTLRRPGARTQEANGSRFCPSRPYRKLLKFRAPSPWILWFNNSMGPCWDDREAKLGKAPTQLPAGSREERDYRTIAIDSCESSRPVGRKCGRHPRPRHASQRHQRGRGNADAARRRGAPTFDVRG
jgi:hypothetical protein